MVDKYREWSEQSKFIYLSVTLFAVLSVLGCTKDANLGLDLRNTVAVASIVEAAAQEDASKAASLIKSYPDLLQVINSADEIQILKETRKRKASDTSEYTGYRVYQEDSSGFTVLQGAFNLGVVDASQNTSRAPPEHLLVFCDDGKELLKLKYCSVDGRAEIADNKGSKKVFFEMPMIARKLIDQR